MQPESGSSQAQERPQRAAKAPPLGLTDRGKAALAQARRGDAQAAERPVIEAEIPSAGPQDNEPQPDVPALGTSFLGMADTEWFPPDHQIATGPNNIVVATNGGVNILSKRGNSLSSQTLGGFFSPLGTEHSDAFDPWLAYDPYLNRFWLMAVSIDTTTQRSDILIALSNTSDATLGWRMWELSGSVNGSTNTTNWCDYPKLGFDSQAVYVTCNMFAFGGGFQYSKLRILNKSQFVNNTAIFWWDFWDIREGGTGTAKAFTIQPAVMYGATTSTGGFLVNARGGGGTGSTLDVWRVPNPLECCNGDAVGPTLNNQGRSVGGYGPSDGARQSGTTTQINNGDSRLLYAVWKNGKLSTGHTVACPSSATDACGGFTELNVANYPTITTLNNWALTAGGEDVYYPAVSVNNADDKTMVFTVSHSSRFASAAWVGIPSSADCTTCVDGGTNILRSGQSSYVRLDDRNRNRWGDYSGASPDPNGEGIWIVGEFAAATANTWGAQVGLTYQNSPPPANDNFGASQTISGPTASVSGTTRYATREPNEPDHYPDSNLWSGTHSVWYRWTAPASGSATLDTCTTNIDSLLAVYTGSSLGGLSRIADDNNGCSNGWGSKVTFNAVAGTTYRIAVADTGGLRENTFTLNISGATPDTVKPGVDLVKPTENAKRIAPRANVLAFFSEAMQAGSINTSTVNLFKKGATTPVAAVVTYDAATKKATLNPNANLKRGVKYKAVVTTGTKDLAGNPLDQNSSQSGDQPKKWFFTVRN